ncbi:myoinositol oxygenase, putative [Perkinsus marinus ATCC 50983]|uniref:Inositol oxygenase n=1 Tax=Perkinsus marinus (strain ATCC 50983 / TXsc) TaxID=423536 RepID=C5LP59_PERM5|nr:myoinositol oxygenase, putative [Perkinsus marinus ATCC 50983]EER01478.1 myoinositol oxygenase, putative [Perkinsus marinus ATCC 50983]|eukprot:XP_002768760.1 myoinositol oxygenase, putative [Perkinsus marinus ATCC 50983]
MAPEDSAKVEIVKEFNKFDLYSKGDDLPEVAQLEPLYLALAEKYGLGGKIRW